MAGIVPCFIYPGFDCGSGATAMNMAKSWWFIQERFASSPIILVMISVSNAQLAALATAPPRMHGFGLASWLQVRIQEFPSPMAFQKESAIAI